MAKQFRDSFREIAVSVQRAMPKAGILGMGDLLTRALGTAKTLEDLKKVQELINEIMERFAKAEEEAGDLFGQMLEAGFQIPNQFRHQFDALLPQLTGANKKMLEQLLGSEVNWKKMAAAAEAFGIDVDSLGKKFQLAKFKDRAKELVDVWELLTSGAPEAQGGVLFGLKDEIQALVIEARKFGLSIPENFRPLIERLIVTKQLFDENGELITDLGQIHFGDKIKSEFDKITEAILKLIETLQGLYNMQPPGSFDRTNPAPPPGSPAPNRPPADDTVPPPDIYRGSATLGAQTVRAIMEPSTGSGTPVVTNTTVFLPAIAVVRENTPIEQVVDELEQQMYARLASHGITGNLGGSATQQGLREVIDGVAREAARQEMNRG
jgi:hypothetical protein